MYTLFYNGIIHTLESHLGTCEAILVLNDRIIYCGNSKGINLPDYLIQRIDLKQQHVYPGFIDCHTHIASVALAQERIRLDDCLSCQSVLNRVKEAAINLRTDEWVLGSGWNANLWPDDQPHRELLDNLGIENPIALYSKDGHAQWLNSKALNLTGLDQSDKDPAGGKRERDIKGKLTGVVYETCCALVDTVAEKTDYQSVARCMTRLMPKLFALGITGVHSCEGLDKFRFFQQMELNGRLDIRICMHPPADTISELQHSGLHSAWGNHWLRLGGLKYFVDGSLGSQTAEMFGNYNNLDHAGVEVLTEEELTDNLCAAAKKGWGATIHAIGDKANHKALNAIAETRKMKNPVPFRHRIEHCQIIHPNDIKRFKDLQVISSMQPLHIADDAKIAEQYLGQRAIYAYPVNSLMQNGYKVVFGSDMPVAEPHPIKGMLAAVCRKYKLKGEEATWNSNETISAGQALQAYTSDAAYASYEEADKGTLSPGKLADFVALSGNIETADETDLRNCRVNMTVLGGRIVFNRQSDQFLQ